MALASIVVGCVFQFLEYPTPPVIITAVAEASSILLVLLKAS